MSGYQSDIDSIIKIKKMLESNVEEIKEYVDFHQSKFYWKFYFVLRNKHFEHMRKYADEAGIIYKQCNTLIKLIREIEEYKYNKHYCFYEHRLNTYLDKIENVFFTFKRYKRTRRDLHSDYCKLYERVKESLEFTVNDISREKTRRNFNFYSKYENVFNETVWKSSEKKKVEGVPKHIGQALRVIGVPKGSVSIDTVKKYYKIAAKNNHPDRGGSVEAMQEINKAYNILKEYFGRKK